MIEFEFLVLLHLKQIQLLISIRRHGKFQLSTTFALVSFQEDIQQFVPQAKISLKGKDLVVPSTIIPSYNVQRNVKHKLDFDESKSNFKQKPS
jgi:hypothetical protein